MIRLSEDVSNRIQNSSARANQLCLKLNSVEKRINNTDVTKILKLTNKKKFKSRNAYIPSILTKNTNAEQIKFQYTLCNLPPQLWKMETVIPEDCVIHYSHPGWF
jgi:hypothetical protein